MLRDVVSTFSFCDPDLFTALADLLLFKDPCIADRFLLPDLFLLLPLAASFQFNLLRSLRLPHRVLSKIFKTLLTPRSQVNFLLLPGRRLPDLFLLGLLLLADPLHLLLLGLPLLANLFLLGLLLLTDLFDLLLALLTDLVLLLLIRLPLLLPICLPLLTLLSFGFFLFLINLLIVHTVTPTIPLRVRIAAQTEQQSAESGGRNTESTK